MPRKIRQSTLAKMSNEKLRTVGYIRIPGFTRADGTKVKSHIRKLDPPKAGEKGSGEIGEILGPKSDVKSEETFVDGIKRLAGGVLKAAVDALVGKKAEAGWFSNEFDLGTHNGEPAFVMNGMSIDEDTAISIKKMIKQNPDVKQVVIGNSMGGKSYYGMKAGFLIRQAGLTTVLTGGCESACTYIWGGGADRKIEGEGYLGYHPPMVSNPDYSSEVNEAADKVSLTRVRKYFEHMDVPVDHFESLLEGNAWSTVHVKKAGKLSRDGYNKDSAKYEKMYKDNNKIVLAEQRRIAREKKKR